MSDIKIINASLIFLQPIIQIFSLMFGYDYLEIHDTDHTTHKRQWLLILKRLFQEFCWDDSVQLQVALNHRFYFQLL